MPGIFVKTVSGGIDGKKGPQGFNKNSILGVQGYVGGALSGAPGSEGEPGPTCICRLDEDVLDVGITGATSGEIILYDGVSDNIWKNVLYDINDLTWDKIDFSGIPSYSDGHLALITIGPNNLYKLLSDETTVRRTKNVFLVKPDVYYRADNIDGQGNAGNSSTETLINLINFGTYDGIINNGTVSGGGDITQDVSELGTPFEYGVEYKHDSVNSQDGDTYIKVGPTDSNYHPQNGTQPLSSWSIEYWIKIVGTQSETFPLFMEHDTTFPSPSANSYRNLLTFFGETEFLFYQNRPVSSGSSESSISVNPYNRPRPYEQVVATLSGTTLSFYLDGILKSSGTIGVGTYSGSEPDNTYLGVYYRTDGVFFGMNARVSVVRIYDQALTAGEVLDHYNEENSF